MFQNRLQRRGSLEHGEPRTWEPELNVRMGPGGGQFPFLLRSGVGGEEANRGWQRLGLGRPVREIEMRSRNWARW